MFRSLGVDIEFLAPSLVATHPCREDLRTVIRRLLPAQPLTKARPVWPVFDKLPQRITLNKKSSIPRIHYPALHCTKTQSTYIPIVLAAYPALLNHSVLPNIDAPEFGQAKHRPFCNFEK